MTFEVEFQRGFGGSYFYVPKTKGPCPSILVLHGSDGGRAGWSHWQALLFATHGFCTLAPNYSKGGNGWHAGDIVDVDLDETESALVWLRDSEMTDHKVGLFGISRGAEHALLVTSLMARDGSAGLPDAVAVHSPSDTIIGAFIADHFDPNGDEVWDPAKRAWRWRGSSDALLPTSPIEIERYAGPLFLSHGEADKVWTVDCTRRLEERLRVAGRRPEVHYYPDEDYGLKPETHTIQQARLVDFFRRGLLTD